VFSKRAEVLKVEKTAEKQTFYEHNARIMLEDKIIALIMLEILGLCSDYDGIMLYAPIFLRHINYAGTPHRSLVPPQQQKSKK
jgi:hypothetical protein